MITPAEKYLNDLENWHNKNKELNKLEQRNFLCYQGNNTERGAYNRDTEIAFKVEENDTLEIIYTYGERYTCSVSQESLYCSIPFDVDKARQLSKFLSCTFFSMIDETQTSFDVSCDGSKEGIILAKTKLEELKPLPPQVILSSSTVKVRHIFQVTTAYRRDKYGSLRGGERITKENTTTGEGSLRVTCTIYGCCAFTFLPKVLCGRENATYTFSKDKDLWELCGFLEAKYRKG